MKFDIEKTKLVIFVDQNDQTRVIEIDTIEREKSIGPINIHTLHGSVPVFEEEKRSICSNADVALEIRSIPKTCGKECCDL